MGVKLMKELLRRGKTGNDILKILDAVTSSNKLSTEVQSMVLGIVNDEEASL